MTAMQQWEAIDSNRRRSAWVHQHVFGKRFWKERRGEYVYKAAYLTLNAQV